MRVCYKPVHVEIDDDNTRIFHVFEMRIGMNEFDHSNLPFKYMKNSCIHIKVHFCGVKQNIDNNYYCRMNTADYVSSSRGRRIHNNKKEAL